MDADWLSTLDRDFAWSMRDLQSLALGVGSWMRLSREEIEDVIQKSGLALTSAFRDGIPSRIVTREQLDAYVKKTVRTQAMEVSKKRVERRAREIIVDPADLQQAVARDLGAELPEGMSDVVMEEILKELPRDKRRLPEFLRLRLAGLSEKAIAQQLGVSPPTVSRRLADCEKYVTLELLERVLEHRAQPGGES